MCVCVSQLQKQKQNVALMKVVLSSKVNIDAVDYVSLFKWFLSSHSSHANFTLCEFVLRVKVSLLLPELSVFCVWCAEGQHSSSLRLSEEESSSAASAAGEKLRHQHPKQCRY